MRLIQMRFKLSCLLLLSFLSLRFVVGGEELQSANCSPIDGYDGSSVVFSARTGNYWQIWKLDVSKGSATVLTSSPIDKRTPRFGKNGTVVVYRDSSGRVFEYDLEKKTDTAIKPIDGFIMDPQMSPSGTKLAFSRFQSEPNDNADIYFYSFDKGALTKVTDEATLEYSPAWSSDEKNIAFVSGRGARKHFLYVINLETKIQKLLQNLPADDLSPAWSPDDKWIIFSSCRTEDYEIWRVRPDGTEIQQLTRSPGLDSTPTYSPTGQHILFTSNREGKLGLWLMKEDGSDQRRITPAELIAREPHWWIPSAKGGAQ